MRVRTFRGRSAKSVLDRVKAEMGCEAVILNTQTLTEGGTSVCEITAALEQDEPQGPPEGLDSPPGWGQWNREWDQIKTHLMTLMRPQFDLGVLTPRQRMPLEHLEADGVGQGVIMALWRELKDRPKASVLEPLARLFKALPFGPERWKQRLHAVAGPAGAGKTTSLLRLALMHKQTRPDDDILVLNADVLHGKGRLFLKHYCDLSGLAYREARSAADMTKTLAEAGGHARVFIDLPAVPRGATLEATLGLLGLGQETDMAVHLVLSPLYGPAQTEAYVRRHASDKTAGIIWTKLDEACSFGSLVNVAFATGLPVSALSHGQGLRGSMAAAEQVMLWRLIFKGEMPDEAGIQAPGGRRTQ